MKFEDLKVGDKVVIKNRRGGTWNILGKMDYLMGATVEIVGIAKWSERFFVLGSRGDGPWALRDEDIDWEATNKLYDKLYAKLYAQRQTFVGTKFFNDGPKTVVILPDGRRGEAICAPDDEFNPVTGVAIAYGRALAQTK